MPDSDLADRLAFADDDRRIGDQVFVPANQLSGNLTLIAPLVALAALCLLLNFDLLLSPLA